MKNFGITTLILGLSIAAAGCGGKPAPKSTTTTRIQSDTVTEDGDKKSSDTVVKTTEEADGTQTVETKGTTNTTAPSPK